MEGQKQPSNQKRILLGNPKLVTRLLDTYQATRALMNHRNMPQQDTNLSPLFGRPLIETICPITIDNKYRQEWVRIADKKEEALAKHRIFTKTTDRELKPLETGDSVQIQNKTGNHRNRWYSTGTISEALPNRQYQVIVGSLRVTLRIEGFYEKLTQYAERYRNHLYCHPTDLLSNLNKKEPLLLQTPTRLWSPTAIVEEAGKQSTPAPRRGERIRKLRRPLSPKLTGQSHD